MERLALARPATRLIRVGHPARLTATAQRYALETAVAASDTASIIEEVRQDLDAARRRFGSTPKAARGALRHEYGELRRELRAREDRAVTAILTTADVVLGTPATLSLLGSLAKVPVGHFSVAVLDEAGQALEVAAWIPLLQVRLRARGLRGEEYSVHLFYLT